MEQDQVGKDLGPKILETVLQHPGITGVDLVSKLTVWLVKIQAGDLPVSYVNKFLDDLVSECKLIRVAYISPLMPYREKALYFPATTEITVEGIPK